MPRLLLLLLPALLLGANDPKREDWLRLFNGKNLKGWTPKIRGHAFGDNFGKTFRVEKGVIKVSYDAYDNFNERFGHLFYKDSFSYYVIAVEYRFTGDQAKGGPSWATRNSGIMVHGQPGATLTPSQDFPVSIEVQLLGGNGKDPRTTANLCTPGTNVVRDGKLFTPHCVNSTSQTYAGEQWVRAEVRVLGNERIEHRVNGELVLAYEQPQLGGGNVKEALPEWTQSGKMLSEGSISLQSESHPVEFRKVELLNLKGCMDPKAKNFKSYYVKADNAACKF